MNSIRYNGKPLRNEITVKILIIINSRLKSNKSRIKSCWKHWEMRGVENGFPRGKVRPEHFRSIYVFIRSGMFPPQHGGFFSHLPHFCFYISAAVIKSLTFSNLGEWLNMGRSSTAKRKDGEKHFPHQHFPSRILTKIKRGMKQHGQADTF